MAFNLARTPFVRPNARRGVAPRTALRWIAASLAVLAILLAGLPAPDADAQNTPAGDEPVHPFVTDKDGLQIEKFIRWASQALGRPFIWAPSALQQAKNNAKVVVITEEMKIPQSSLLDFVRFNLRVHDLALIPMGPPEARFILIENLQAPTLLKNNKKFVPQEELEKYKDSYVLIVTTITVKHVNVQQIQTQIQRLTPQATPYGTAIIPAPSENAFIVVDFGPEVYNLARLIREMDKQGTKFDQTLEIVNLQHASADEIEGMLTEILEESSASPRPGQPGGIQGIGGPKQPPAAKIIPDDRASRLVVYATPDDHEMIRNLVKQLDTEIPASTGRVTVYPLKNTVAEDMVETLNEIMEGGSSSKSRSGPSGGPGQGSISTRGGGDGVDIVADKGSNALLIRGSKSQKSEVIEIIKKLDVRKPQVLVEAAIIELQHSNTLDLGVELGAFDGKDNLASTFRPFGLTNFGLSSVDLDPNNGLIRLPNTNSAGIVGGIFDGDGFLFPVLVEAFQAKGYTNLLSMPSILTNDNQEATISISRSVAVAQLNQGAAGQVSTQTFGEYETAPIELTISPHISSDDYLRLEINFLVEVFGAGGGAGVPPPKTARNITTAVTVPNGATVVIGGLTLDEQTENTSQIPILGDIPILGALFRATTTQNQKNTLFLFLTPRILSDPKFRDLDDISTRKKAEIAALKGQVDLVDPEFGRRFRMLDRAKSIADVEATGAFDLPVIHSPTDELDDGIGIQSESDNPAAPKTAAPKAAAPKSGNAADAPTAPSSEAPTEAPAATPAATPKMPAKRG